MAENNKDKCVKCNINIGHLFNDAIADYEQENVDGFYNNENDENFCIFIICKKCGGLNKIEIKKSTYEIIEVTKI